MKNIHQNSKSGWLQNLVLLILKGYKKYISPFLPSACRFEPTCSVYMYQAIEKMGILKKTSGPALLEIRVKKGARSDLGRPKTNPKENKSNFMEFLSN